MAFASAGQARAPGACGARRRSKEEGGGEDSSESSGSRCSGGSAGLGAGGVESLSVQRQASCLYVSLMLLGSFTLPVVLS